MIDAITKDDVPEIRAAIEKYYVDPNSVPRTADIFSMIHRGDKNYYEWKETGVFCPASGKQLPRK